MHHEKTVVFFWVSIGSCWKTGWWLVYLSWTQKLLRHRCIKSRIVALVVLISFPLLTPKEISKNTHKNKNTQQLQPRVLCQHFHSRHLCILRCGEPVTFCKAKRFVSGTLGGCDQSQLHWNEGRCTQIWWAMNTNIYTTNKKRTRPGVLFECVAISFENFEEVSGWLAFILKTEIKCIKQKTYSGG